MRSQRIDLTTVDFAQQVLISCHTAELPVPVGFCLNPAFFPVNLEKLRIRGNHFCNDGPYCSLHASSVGSRYGYEDTRHRAGRSFPPGVVLHPSGSSPPHAREAAVGTYHLNQTLAEQADK